MRIRDLLKRALLFTGCVGLVASTALCDPISNFKELHGTKKSLFSSETTVDQKWFTSNLELMGSFFCGRYVVETENEEVGFPTLHDAEMDRGYAPALFLRSGDEVTISLNGVKLAVKKGNDENAFDNQISRILFKYKSSKPFWVEEKKPKMSYSFDQNSMSFKYVHKLIPEMLGIWYRGTITTTYTKDPSGDILVHEYKRTKGVMSGGKEDVQLSETATMLANNRTTVYRLKKID